MPLQSERPTDVTTLTEFLLARIAEAEQLADDCLKLGADIGDLTGWVEIGSDKVDAVEALADRFSPARVLAECEAKRRIVAELEAVQPVWDDLAAGYSPEDWLAKRVALALASVDADHPDYQEAWRPEPEHAER